MNNRQLKWDRRYMELARLVATWSKDPSTKVGAILVKPNNTVGGTGFNGFAPGADDSPALYADRAYKYQHVIHAEVNAINFSGTAKGATVYTSFPACPNCVRYAIQAGVARIVQPPLPTAGRSAEWVEEWRRNGQTAYRDARENGLLLETLEDV